MTQYDLHIKNGTIVDGTRVPRFKADLWIKDGHIAQIGGRAQGSAAREIDAEGLIVAPGFVDLHTHYDAQIQWDPYCTISGWHGVTSVVLGNCGFGFAPVPPDGRDRAMLTMSRTEAIPFDSMKAGMLWDWVTFPEWLASLERMPKGVNCLTYMPIAPLMIWVMGLEAAKTRPATRQEQAEMKALLHEAMDAGACGFSLQRLGEHSVQADYDGTPMVTDTMCDEDVLALAEVLAERDEGFIQITQFTGDLDKDLAFQEKLAAVSGRPILHNVVAVVPRKPEVHRERLQWLEDANARGLRIFGQSFTMRTGFAFTLEHWNLYDSSPAWNRATTGTFEEKMAKMQDPEIRAAIRAETDAAIEKLGRTQALFLAWMVRDEGKVSLEEAHYRLSFLPAFAAGFRDRGFLREGAPADIVVYDLDALEVTPRWVGDIAHDFPANEWRRVQRAQGYRAILVNGEPTFEDGECTGRTPGRLLRHGQA